MERVEKEAEVKFLTQVLNKAQVALCTDYRGLTVSQLTKLRRDLRAKGAQGRVVKNTLARISAKEAFPQANSAEISKFVELFKGPTFVVYSDTDPVTPAKVVADFMKTAEKLTVKGGWVDGSCLDKGQVEELSKMPGKAETLARLLQVLLGPATKLARLINEPGSRVVRVLEARRSSLEGGNS